MSISDDEKLNNLNEAMKLLTQLGAGDFLSVEALNLIGMSFNRALEMCMDLDQQFEIPIEMRTQVLLASLSITLQDSGLIKDKFILKPDTN
jgi:hypothetical protein